MLFAIGDAIFDVFGKPKGGESADDLNSTCYFTDRKEQSTQAPLHSLQTHAGEVAARGGFRLQFFDEGNRPAKFQYPYPTVKPGTVMAPEGKVEVPGTFKWED